MSPPPRSFLALRPRLNRPLLRPLRKFARNASRKANPWPDPQPSQDAPKLRSWVYPVSRIANFFIVPTAILYAIFFHDFGDYEHVFMPPRRWLAAQKASFFSLTPEEQRLAGVDTATSETPSQSSGTPRWCALCPSSCHLNFPSTLLLLSDFQHISARTTDP